MDVSEENEVEARRERGEEHDEEEPEAVELLLHVVENVHEEREPSAELQQLQYSHVEEEDQKPENRPAELLPLNQNVHIVIDVRVLRDRTDHSVCCGVLRELRDDDHEREDHHGHVHRTPETLHLLGLTRD